SVAFRSLRFSPVRALHVGPPLKVIVHRNFMVGRRKDDRACNEIFLWRSWEFLLGRRALGDRDVTGRFHELLELLVRDGGLIHEEAVHANAMNGLRIVRSHRHLAIAAPIHNGAHRKLAAGNPNHSWRWSA